VCVCGGGGGCWGLLEGFLGCEVLKLTIQVSLSIYLVGIQV